MTWDPVRSAADDAGASLPIQQRLQRAQARMVTHAPVQLLELGARAEALLDTDAAVERAALMTGLSAEHTHFFPGFGLYLPLPGGIAVGARPSEATSVRVEIARIYGRLGRDEIGAAVSHPMSEVSARVAEEIVGLVADMLGCPVEAVVVLTMPACGESLVAAVAVAAVQAIARADPDQPPLSREARLQYAQQACEGYTRRAFGVAACVAALDGAPPSLLLVDAARRTSREVAPPSRDEVVWGLVHVPPEAKPGGPFAPDFFKLRTAQVQAATLLLRKSPLAVGADPLQTLRDVEHRLIADALALLPDDQQPVVRHLLSEDRRVSRLLMALNRRDGQVLGATLLVSHASLRDDWGNSTPTVQFVYDQGTGVEGLYGMRLTGTGFGGCMLVVGRPFLLPTFLDTVAERYADAYGRPLHTLVL